MLKPGKRRPKGGTRAVSRSAKGCQVEDGACLFSVASEARQEVSNLKIRKEIWPRCLGELLDS